VKSFDVQLKVRFGDVDPAGIVYYPKIFDYIHEAFEELWDVHVGARYYQLLLEHRIGFPLVHSEVDFRHPLRFGDRPRVRVTCTHLGRASIGLAYRFHVDERLCLEALMTVVCVNLEGMTPTPVPEQYRARFEAIMEVQ
jgi:4-hydroxybenzoyl-CoA thioesterase